MTVTKIANLSDGSGLGIIPLKAITYRLTANVTSSETPAGGTNWEKSTEDRELELNAQNPTDSDIAALTTDGAGTNCFGVAETGLYLVILGTRAYTYDGGGSPPAAQNDALNIHTTNDGDQATPTYVSGGGISITIPAITGGANSTYSNLTFSKLFRFSNITTDFLYLAFSTSSARLSGTTALDFTTITFIKLSD